MVYINNSGSVCVCVVCSVERILAEEVLDSDDLTQKWAEFLNLNSIQSVHTVSKSAPWLCGTHRAKYISGSVHGDVEKTLKETEWKFFCQRSLV